MPGIYVWMSTEGSTRAFFVARRKSENHVERQQLTEDHPPAIQRKTAFN